MSGSTQGERKLNNPALNASAMPMEAGSFTPSARLRRGQRGAHFVAGEADRLVGVAGATLHAAHDSVHGEERRVGFRGDAHFPFAAIDPLEDEAIPRAVPDVERQRSRGCSNV